MTAQVAIMGGSTSGPTSCEFAAQPGLLVAKALRLVYEIAQHSSSLVEGQQYILPISNR